MVLLQFDVVTLMEQVIQVRHTSEDTMVIKIMMEFADVFKGTFERYSSKCYS